MKEYLGEWYTLETSGTFLKKPTFGFHPQRHKYSIRTSLGYSNIWPELLPTDIMVIRDCMS